MAELNVTPLNPAQIKAHFDTLYKVKIPALILGSPGVGKSEIVKQWGAERGYHVVTRMLSQIQPGDLSIPTVDQEKNVLRWNVADWLVELPTDRPSILFFDELPSAPNDVRTQIYQLLLDRRLGGHVLPDDCHIMTAGNRVSDGASALELDTALVGRLNLFVVECNPKQWLEWAVDNNVHPSVLTFIKTRSDMLVDEDNFDITCRPSPRSWKMVSDILHVVGKDNVQHSELFQGLIGFDATVTFLKTLQEVSDLPDFKVLKGYSDQELIRVTPEKLSQLWGLAYSLNSVANSVDELAEAMRIIFVMLKNSEISVREDLLAVSFSLMLKKALRKKDGNIKLTKHKYYRNYILAAAMDIPSLEDLTDGFK